MLLRRCSPRSITSFKQPRIRAYSSSSPSTISSRRPFYSSPFFAVPSAFGLGYLSYYLYTSSTTTLATPINPYDFTPYTVASTTPLSPTSAVITLAPIHRSTPPPHFWPTINAAGLWSVQVKQPQLQIQRQYTPLPATDYTTHSDDDTITLFVRAVSAGEVSPYLLSRAPGDTIELRGPVITYPWSTDTTTDNSNATPTAPRNILFLAGGTGISPALQVARHLVSLSGATQPHTLTILYASRSSAESVLPHLTALQKLNNSQLTVDVRFFHDDKGTFIGKSDVEECVPGKDLIMVSGPEGFVRHFAGPKGWKDGEETQGVLGGVVGEILRRRKQQVEVVKL
ncbi:mitochondrial Homoaconitase [Orbilia brochopaga]|uniref:Mitochondrial Homoaconitase n=1 Tax=Orbilia brochopaga TaxID=3140254 RepID=A0AAV9ULK2_9PEZI